MGRKSFNRTYEELLEIKRKRANKYYTSNKEEIKRKARVRYDKLKQHSRHAI